MVSISPWASSPPLSCPPARSVPSGPRCPLAAHAQRWRRRGSVRGTRPAGTLRWRPQALLMEGEIQVLQVPVFQRSGIRSKKSGAGASRIRSRSCYRIQELLIPHFIGSFCLTGAPVKPISSVLQDLLSIKTCSNRSTCDKRSTCNSRSNSNTRSFCNNRNAELSCFWFWSFRSFWCGAPVPNYRIWSCFVGTLHLATKCDAELGEKKDIWSLCSPYVTHACVVGDRPCIIHSWSPLWHFRDPPSFSPRALKHGANNLKAVLGRHEKGCHFWKTSGCHLVVCWNKIAV